MSRIDAKTVMDVWLKVAKQYKADLDPPDGIIKFKLPASDEDNPAGRDMMIYIDVKNQRAKMTNLN
jgi:hypothetical protein